MIDRSDHRILECEKTTFIKKYASYLMKQKEDRNTGKNRFWRHR